MSEPELQVSQISQFTRMYVSTYQMLVTIEHQKTVEERVHLRIHGVPHSAAEASKRVGATRCIGAGGRRRQRRWLRRWARPG